jgi:hypothetical protein
MSIYVKNFRNNCIQIEKRLRVSSFFPDGLKKIIENMVPEKNYVLGVCYNTGDGQICISGHPKEGETLSEGTSRELEEELCLKSKNPMRIVDKIGFNSYYCLNVRDAFLKQNKDTNKNKDILDRSVICVYGQEKDILLYLAKVKYNPYNDDGIVSIWSTSREIILNYLETGRGDYIYPIYSSFVFK